MTGEEFERWLRDPCRPPLVMGVINVTPDSFSDGGQFTDVQAALREALGMAAAGAALIDIGGESTRPGSRPVEAAEQIRRIIPVVQSIRRQSSIAISIDTTRAEVAESALDAGANIINDISAGRDDEAMFPLLARRGAPVILMHMQGTPATMQQNPTYSDVTAEVIEFLRRRTMAAVEAGIDIERICLDPGIGFGKMVAHNLELLRRLPELVLLGRPVVIGTSRKGFIGKIIGETDPLHRVHGTGATVAWSFANGAAIARVHDVEPMIQVVKMIQAIMHGEATGSG